MLAINEQDNHLTIALVHAMMRAWTIRMSQTGNLQIESLLDAKIRLGQLLSGPSLNLFTGLIESQERDKGAHSMLSVAISIGT